jgi:3-deoxy-D-manno-octulosonic-acid transferase
LGSRAIYFGYRVLGVQLFPVLLLYFLIRALRNRRYWGTLRQRLGFLPGEYHQTGAGSVWFHAVSVGEVIAIVPLVRRVKEMLPGASVFVSTTTLAGFAAAHEKFTAEVSGIFFLPIDYPFAIRRVLRRIRPSVVAIAETEIWPNLFREIRRSGAGLVIVGGRISDAALPRYVHWRWFFRAALEQVDLVLAQSALMRDRYLSLGSPAARTEVGGNLKYDAEPIPAKTDSPVAEFFSGCKVWIAASTSADGTVDEEDAVLSAFGKLIGWKLLLAPRKPERFPEVAHKLERAGVNWIRRSKLVQSTTADVLLLDTIGELAGLMVLADAVFVGGSLAHLGGHNVLEPAWFGKSITVGPHLENFPDVAAQFREAHAFHEISSPEELAPYVDTRMGARARDCALKNRGSTQLAAQQILKLYNESLPCPLRRWYVRALFTPLSWIWGWGGARRRARALLTQQKLASPVISLGNITVGGTGKTPTVLHLAQWLAARGRNPAVLTRGHGRASPHQLLTVPKGGVCSRSQTGDEPQMLLRSGVLALGVGADRAEAGRALERLGWADVFLMDDGFQHARLARNFDLVLIDALAPFGGCRLVPLGRLREPLTALARASAFLITRVGPGVPLPAILRQLNRYNPAAPVFQSRVIPQEWVALNDGVRFAPHALPFRKVLAFCGLGNPQSFWNTLAGIDVHPIDRLEYDDHHIYTPREVRRFGQLGRALGVEALLTTEKDAMNLCELTAEAIQPLQLFWLRIGIEIDDEETLFQLIESRISS